MLITACAISGLVGIENFMKMKTNHTYSLASYAHRHTRYSVLDEEKDKKVVSVR